MRDVWVYVMHDTCFFGIYDYSSARERRGMKFHSAETCMSAVEFV